MTKSSKFFLLEWAYYWYVFVAITSVFLLLIFHILNPDDYYNFVKDFPALILIGFAWPFTVVTFLIYQSNVGIIFYDWTILMLGEVLIGFFISFKFSKYIRKKRFLALNLAGRKYQNSI